MASLQTRSRNHLRDALGAVALLASMLVTLPLPASAQPARRCFPETGFCISGAIRTYWERNGGLQVFGYPITDQRMETVEGTWTGPVQWFERDRLEDHGTDRQGVLAGRLGARYLELQGRWWQPGNEPRGGSTGSCRYFEQTGYNVCNPAFRTYWEQNGGLERFGYPISDVFQEEIDGRTSTVQYFERRRMEYHPEHAGTPSEVLLGLLGRDLFAASATRLATYRSPDGAWSVQYPEALLHPEELGDGTVLFISRDRRVFAAIDSFVAMRDMYGATGEDLRARARDRLARIYRQPLKDETIMTQPDERWQAGIHFTSAGGATGAALYEQRGYGGGNHRVNGFLYAYPSTVQFLSSQILAVGQSFTVSEPSKQPSLPLSTPTFAPDDGR